MSETPQITLSTNKTNYYRGETVSLTYTIKNTDYVPHTYILRASTIGENGNVWNDFIPYEQIVTLAAGLTTSRYFTIPLSEWAETGYWGVYVTAKDDLGYLHDGWQGRMFSVLAEEELPPPEEPPPEPPVEEILENPSITLIATNKTNYYRGNTVNCDIRVKNNSNVTRKYLIKASTIAESGTIWNDFLPIAGVVKTIDAYQQKTTTVEIPLSEYAELGYWGIYATATDTLNASYNTESWSPRIFSIDSAMFALNNFRYKTYYYRQSTYGTTRPKLLITSRIIASYESITAYIKSGETWYPMEFWTGQRSWISDGSFTDVEFAMSLYPAPSTGLPDATHRPELYGTETEIKVIANKNANEQYIFTAIITPPRPATDSFIYTSGIESYLISTKTTKRIGESLSIDFDVTNTGTIDNTFGIGASILDANGVTWDMWGKTDGHIVVSTYDEAVGPDSIVGEDIDTLFIPVNETRHYKLTVTIPLEMAIGDAQVAFNIFKKRSVNIHGSGVGLLTDLIPETHTGWMNDLLTII